MENEVDLSSGNPLDLTPKGPLAGENLALQSGPDLSSTPNIGPGSSPLYPGLGQGALGSNRTMYPVQSANPLDDAERILKADRDRMQIGLTGPKSGLLQFLAPNAVKKLGEEAAQTDLKIQDIQQKRQQQKDIQRAGDLAGLPPGTLPATATNDTLVNELTNRFRTTGDPKTMEALLARGHKDIVATYMPDAVAAQETKVYREKEVITALDATISPPNQKVYLDVLKTLTPEDRKMFKIPATATEWLGKRRQAYNDNQTSLQMVENFKQQRAQWSDFTPETDKNAAEVRQNSLKLNGEVMPGTTAVKHLGNGATGNAGPFGSDDPRMFGEKGTKGWDVFKKPQIEETQKMADAAFPKTEREKNISISRTYKMATTDKDGKPLGKDEINTNPNIQQAVSEALAAALRGGAGGANGQLLRLEVAKRGVVQDAFDKFMSAKAGLYNTITGKELKPYLTQITGLQIRDVLDFIKNYNEKDIGARLGGVAEKVGSYGGRLDQIGIEPELQDALKNAHAYGRDKSKYEISTKPRIIRDHDSVFLEGGKAALAVPGAMVTPLPLSALPGLTPKADNGNGEIAPSQGLHSAALTVPGPANATLTNGSSSGPSGGGGAPASGISQDYLIKTAKVESGNEPDPWGSGNSKTSASGAYQFTNATWNQYKPPGAPNRAAEATPQQQTEAANNLTNANAKVLARNDIPVNDTTAYIAHNLGAAGAVNFMKARDDAKARAVVGETAANNNPLFFKGDPTVAEVKARYAKVMNQPTAEQIAAYNANREGFAATRAKMAASATHNAANIAPALGAVAGMPLGPAGSIAGGALGGAVRQGFNGGPGYVDQMARGALEAVPAAVPGVRPLTTVARVVAGGAVPAAEKLYDSGGEDTAGAIESGAAGAAGGMIGEGAGIFGHALWSKFGPGPGKELVAAAKVLATQEPKIADATGKMVPNAVYAKAKQDIEAIGKNPDQVAHDTRATMMAGAPSGEALAKRPAEIERIAAGREMNAVQKEVGAAGGNVPVPSHASLPNGPASTIRTAQNPNGTVPDTPFWRKTAQHYEINATAPAKNVDSKWERIGQDRSELLEKERVALGSSDANKKEMADGFRAIADSLGEQQKVMARALLSPDRAKVAIERLDTARQRYARAMTAGAGEKGDIVKAIAKGGQDGREAQAAFDALAGNDPAAKRMVRSLVAAEKGVGVRAGIAGALGASTLLLHSIPVVGNAAALAVGAISTMQGLRAIRDFMAKKGAGAPITFKTVLDRELGHARRVGSVVGSSIGNQMAQ